MLHYTFLWQVLGMLIGFGCMTVVLMQYRMYRRRALLFFLASIGLTFIRTVLFTINSYSIASRTSFLSANFEQSLIAGFIYILLISGAAYFLVLGLYSLYDKKLPLRAGLGYWLYYGLSLSLFLVLLAGADPETTPVAFLFRCGIMTNIPFSACRILIALACVFLLSDIKDPKTFRLSAAFMTAAVAIQAADILGFFVPGSRTASIPAYFILPAAAYMLLLPALLKVLRQTGGSGQDTERLAAEFHLSEEETEIVTAILSGSSNKEIAFDRKLTLSTIKHRIYQIYRKCGIRSRWELFALSERKEPQ